MTKKAAIKIIGMAAMILPVFFVFARYPAEVSATSIEDLQKKIDDRNASIDQLEKEIAQYQDQIKETGKETQTLQTALKALDLSRKKLVADMNVTENKIGAANLKIEELDFNISEKSDQISNELDGVSKSLVDLNEADSKTLVEVLLSYDNMSDYWEVADRIGQLQESIKEKISTLKNLKKDFEGNKAQKEKERKNLVSLKAELADRKKIIEDNQKEKDQLLKETKNKESNYKKILDAKVAMKNAFEKELSDFESQLKIAIDPNSIPHSGSGVLTWPLDKIIVSQYFGNTEFAKTTTAYSGNGHNGVDFATPVGTPVKAALSGIIQGVGDTDIVCPGASFGRWVFIKHGNGLSTIYAHLSLIKVTKGQSVSTGQVIGYSGNTGFSTGPHLHFGVYASQGVEIMSRKSQVCGGTYTMPIADLKAYLNPMLYL